MTRPIDQNPEYDGPRVVRMNGKHDRFSVRVIAEQVPYYTKIIGEDFCHRLLDKAIDEAHELSQWLQSACMEMGETGDDLYNDSDFLADILGDRIHDVSEKNLDLKLLIAGQLGENAHEPLKKVCVEIIEETAEEIVVAAKRIEKEKEMFGIK